MTNEELRQAIKSIDMKGWKVYQLEQPDKSCYCHVAGCTVDRGQLMPKEGWAYTTGKISSWVSEPEYWKADLHYIKYRDTVPENVPELHFL